MDSWAQTEASSRFTYARELLVKIHRPLTWDVRVCEGVQRHSQPYPLHVFASTASSHFKPQLTDSKNSVSRTWPLCDCLMQKRRQPRRLEEACQQAIQSGQPLPLINRRVWSTIQEKCREKANWCTLPFDCTEQLRAEQSLCTASLQFSFRALQGSRLLLQVCQVGPALSYIICLLLVGRGYTQHIYCNSVVGCQPLIDAAKPRIACVDWLKNTGLSKVMEMWSKIQRGSRASSKLRFWCLQCRRIISHISLDAIISFLMFFEHESLKDNSLVSGSSLVEPVLSSWPCCFGACW